MSDLKAGPERISFLIEQALKRKDVPAPNQYNRQLQWKPATAFQKQSTTPNVTFIGQIMKRKK